MRLFLFTFLFCIVNASSCDRNSYKYKMASSYLVRVDNFFKLCSEQCTNKPRNVSDRFAVDTINYMRCVNKVCASAIPSGTSKHRAISMYEGYMNVEGMLFQRRDCVETNGCSSRVWDEKDMHKCMSFALGMEDTLAERGVDRYWDRHNSSCARSQFCPPVQSCDCGEIDTSATDFKDASPYRRDNDKVGDGMIAFFKQCSQRCDTMEGVLNKRDCVNHLCSFDIPSRTEKEFERFTTQIYTLGDNRIDIERLLNVPRRCKEENPENERDRQICLVVMEDFERLMAARGIERSWTLEEQSCKGENNCLKRCDCLGLPYPKV